MEKIHPGATIGVLGGGQLGKMMAQEAKTMGYKVITLDPTPDCPTAQVCGEQVVAKYDDLEAALKLKEKCDVITYEFENIDVKLVEKLEKDIKVYPGSHVLKVTQHRVYEKQFLKDKGIAVADFAAVNNLEDLKQAAQTIGYPAVLKTCRFGYDGKGQAVINNDAEAEAALEKFTGQELIWEKMIPFTKEISVICAHNPQGDSVTYPIPENIHQDNILDISIVPARISAETSEKASAIAKKIAHELNIIGTFATEMFVLENGDLLVNELAPRPHNSGHYTIEGCFASQFENQVRAICSLPLGSTQLLSPTVMVNILGESTGNNIQGLPELFSNPRIRFHLYGKAEAKAKRKMGHFTVIAEDAETALQEAMEAREKLSWK